MAVLKIDLQRMSLGALVIAMGMMVDNAIVVVDNMLVRLGRGMNPEEAAIESASKPAMPLLGATAIAILAFYPIAASTENAGEYLCIPFFNGGDFAWIQLDRGDYRNACRRHAHAGKSRRDGAGRPL